MNTVMRVVSIAAAMAAATAVIGWVGVPAVAALAAAVLRTRDLPRLTALAASLAWGLLLLWRFTAPGFSALLDRLGALFPIPGWGVALLALVVAEVLAWSSARLVLGLMPPREPSAG